MLNYEQHLVIDLPNIGQCITPGCVVQLSRFDTEAWKVGFGWYAWGGNREVCGWYLTSMKDPQKIKPLQKPDLDDIYCITREEI